MKWFFIVIVSIAIIGLVCLEIIFPGFLQKYIYPLSMVVTSCLLTWIAYLTYNMAQPKINTTVWLLYKNDDIMKQQFPTLESETGFFLMVIAENAGKGTVNSMRIHNNKNQTLYLFNNLRTQNQKKDFGYILKEGERTPVDIQPLNPHYLQVFKQSSGLYVEDIRKRKYPVSKKTLKNGQKHIKKVEKQLSKN